MVTYEYAAPVAGVTCRGSGALLAGDERTNPAPTTATTTARRPILLDRSACDVCVMSRTLRRTPISGQGLSAHRAGHPSNGVTFCPVVAGPPARILLAAATEGSPPRVACSQSRSSSSSPASGCRGGKDSAMLLGELDATVTQFPDIDHADLLVQRRRRGLLRLAPARTSVHVARTLPTGSEARPRPRCHRRPDGEEQRWPRRAGRPRCRFSRGWRRPGRAS